MMCGQHCVMVSLPKLLGLAECGWLDAKDGVYQLDDPAKASRDIATIRAGMSGVVA